MGGDAERYEEGVQDLGLGARSDFGRVGRGGTEGVVVGQDRRLQPRMREDRECRILWILSDEISLKLV